MSACYYQAFVWLRAKIGDSQSSKSVKSGKITKGTPYVSCPNSKNVYSSALTRPACVGICASPKYAQRPIVWRCDPPLSPFLGFWWFFRKTWSENGLKMPNFGLFWPILTVLTTFGASKSLSFEKWTSRAQLNCRKWRQSTLLWVLEFI